MVSAAPVMSPVDAKRSDRMTVNNAQVDKMNWRKVVIVCFLLKTIYKPLMQLLRYVYS